jgi:hypothetical protein
MTHCSSLFNSSKKNSFGFAANRKIGKAEDLSAPLHNIRHRWWLMKLNKNDVLKHTGDGGSRFIQNVGTY